MNACSLDFLFFSFYVKKQLGSPLCKPASERWNTPSNACLITLGSMLPNGYRNWIMDYNYYLSFINLKEFFHVSARNLQKSFRIIALYTPGDKNLAPNT